jgi:Secretion system C-terminal sorting domain
VFSHSWIQTTGTLIEFSIPEQSFIKLEVFNALGEKITTLVSEELNAGNYKYEWNAERLPSGIYIYQLQAPQHSEINKMVLLK